MISRKRNKLTEKFRKFKKRKKNTDSPDSNDSRNSSNENNSSQITDRELNRIFNNATNAMMIIDRNFNVIRVNKSFLSLSGLCEKEALSKKCYEIFHNSSHCHTSSCALKQILNGERRIVTKDELKTIRGNKFPCIVTTWMLENNNGDIIGAVEDINDISEFERVRIELQKNNTALKESERELRALLESTGHIIFVIDNNGIFHNVVTGSEGIFTEFKARGRNYREVLPENLIKIFSKHFDNVYKTKKNEIIQFNSDTGNSGKWYECRTSPIFEGGKATDLMVSVITDITFREKMEASIMDREEMYRSLFESSPDGIMIIDDTTKKLRFASPSFCNLLGYSEKEALNLGLSDILQEKDRNLFISERKADAVQKRHIAEDITCLKKDGSKLPADIAWTTSIILGKKCNICFVRDTTEKNRSMKEKEKMQKEIFQASRLASIGELAAGVAHEINNPLSIIYENMELLREFLQENKLYSDISRSFINPQEPSIKRISTIVMGLKKYSRPSNERMERINIHNTIEETLTLIEGMYRKDNVFFEKHLGAPRTIVRANAGYMQQVLMNIFSNAKDAMEDIKSGRIVIATENDDNRIKIKISDIGCGIKKSDIQRIFDSFYTTKEAGKGTGLGLGICYEIIKNFNGKIYVDSEEGIGTTFTLELPLTAGKITPGVINVEQTFEKIAGRVLVVDDEAAIRSIICRNLTELGLEVDEAANGKSALEKLKANSYDYLITDLKMPVMDGTTLLNETKNINMKNTGIIVITGCIIEEYSDEQRKTLKELSKGIIKKPFAKNELYRVLKETKRG